ncbi:MAG TPA: tRNA (guanosine(37)-N1)-methyltransferase TrmD [Candidatus Saccharimonadales bacterium]|nr:tRNA (guanosine(37)-N1)-methyltransferase TrmD [Candidatus Saccharimonadales bacterium]
MKIDIITLFPDMFKGPFDMSMVWKAKDRGLVEINLRDLREFGLGPRRQVDDVPYGGGPGMVLKPEPVFAAVEAAKRENPSAKVIILTPSGNPYDQTQAEQFATQESLILICGHYEGFDERIASLADYQISIGDYILTGGELAAMVVVDSIVRLLPGVLGSDDSAIDETFTSGMLEYPHYTRPEEFRGMAVPDVLLSGHHGEIQRWRKDQAKIKTKKQRPDLLK